MNQMNAGQNELTDAELAMVHGGGFLSDAWNAVKDFGKNAKKTLIEIFRKTFPRNPGPFVPIYY